MKNWNLLFIIYLLVGCQSSTEKEVTMDELNKPSQKYVSIHEANNIKELKVSDFDSLSYFSKRLVDTLGIFPNKVHPISSLLFPDRFNPIQSDKWYGITSKDSFVYKHWKYLDTNVAENTFYNWLDNFGEKHLSLNFGDKLRVSSNAFVLLLQHKSLLLLESNQKMEKKQILTLLDTLGFGSTWKMVLFQAKGKQTEWFEQLNLKSNNENSKP